MEGKPRFKSNAWKTVAIVIGITLSICLLSVSGGLLLLNFIFSGACGNQLYQEVLSPDNKYKAVVFQRDCGATTGFSTRVSILRADAKFTDKVEDNIFLN
jgi:hypothetical protein